MFHKSIDDNQSALILEEMTEVKTTHNGGQSIHVGDHPVHGSIMLIQSATDAPLMIRNAGGVPFQGFDDEPAFIDQPGVGADIHKPIDMN